MTPQTDNAAPYRVSKIQEVARSTDLWVRELTVVAGEEVPWHRHTYVSDRCYGLDGVILVECVDEQDRFTQLLLRPGQSCDLPVGTRHRLSCAEGFSARYLLVQQGQYDFNKVPAPR